MVSCVARVFCVARSLCDARFAGAVTSASDAAFELHVVPPVESDADLSRTIDSFAQASDANLAAGEQALQSTLRDVLSTTQKSVQLLVAVCVLLPPLLCMCVSFARGVLCRAGEAECSYKARRYVVAGSASALILRLATTGMFCYTAACVLEGRVPVLARLLCDCCG